MNTTSTPQHPPATLLEAAEHALRTGDPEIAHQVLDLQYCDRALTGDPDSLWVTLAALEVLGNPTLEITELPDADLVEGLV